MSFGGHVLDMIKRNNQNQALREKHRNRFKDLFRESNSTHGYKHNHASYQRNISPLELQRIKEKIRQQAKKEQIRLAVLTTFISLTSIALLVLSVRAVILYLSNLFN